jgi:hypothetical protein
MTTKTFETDNEILSLHIVTPTIEGVAQPMELLILIETPHTKKKDIVMMFSKREANELLNEIKRLVECLK